MKLFEEKTIKRDVLFKGKIIEVLLDKVRLCDGTIATRELVMHPGAVAILPVTSKGKVILVKQYRKALEQNIWEIPAGKIDGTDNDSLQAAKRELEEEIQMTGDFKFINEFYTSPGFANEKIYLYQVNNLQKIKNPKPRDIGEFLEIKAFSLTDLPQIIDAKTIIALQNLQIKE